MYEHGLLDSVATAGGTAETMGRRHRDFRASHWLIRTILALGRRLRLVLRGRRNSMVEATFSSLPSSCTLLFHGFRGIRNIEAIVVFLESLPR